MKKEREEANPPLLMKKVVITREELEKRYGPLDWKGISLMITAVEESGDYIEKQKERINKFFDDFKEEIRQTKIENEK